MSIRKIFFLALMLLSCTKIFSQEREVFGPVFESTWGLGDAGFFLDINPTRNPIGRMDAIMSFGDFSFTEKSTGLGLTLNPARVRISQNETAVTFLNARLFWNLLSHTESFVLAPYIEGNTLGFGSEILNLSQAEAGLMFSIHKKNWDVNKKLGLEKAKTAYQLNIVTIKGGVRFSEEGLSYFVGMSFDELESLILEILALRFMIGFPINF